MYRTIIFAATVSLLCAGCSATTWKRPSTSAAQAEADFKICDYEANLGLGAGQHTPVYGASMGGAIGSGIGDGIADGLRIVRLRQLCMEARGYRTE